MKNRKNGKACEFQALERRELMSWTPTDNSEVAMHYPTHSGTTMLYLNFDGGTITDMHAGRTRVIAPYVAPAGMTRTEAIQDIIYRVSQVCSPFNVRVAMMRGVGKFDGTYNGNTTIFVGADQENVDSTGRKVSHGSTPWESSDHPGDVKGTGRPPNNDNFDLAFVDPVSFDQNTQTLRSNPTGSTAGTIAHEAGHTFGLTHVLSLGVPDVMSYDSSNTRFDNTSFDTTDLNNSGGKLSNEPRTQVKVNAYDGDFSWVQTITKQNSFAFLKAALGAKNVSRDSYPRSVAASDLVSADYYSAPNIITPASRPSAQIGSLGEYDVYTLSNVSTGKLAGLTPNNPTKLSLATSTPFGSLPIFGLPAFDPQILLYDVTGKNLLASVHGSSLQVQLSAGGNYKVVISGYLGDSVGSYTLSMAQVAPPVLATSTPPSSTPSLFSKTQVSGSTDLVSLLE